MYSFLCPNGTLFSQQYLVCDWWFNVDCDRSEDFYELNDELENERETSYSSTLDRSLDRELRKVYIGG